MGRFDGRDKELDRKVTRRIRFARGFLVTTLALLGYWFYSYVTATTDVADCSAWGCIP